MPSRSTNKRGNIILVYFPNSDLTTAKLRPALIVQSDEIDSEISQIIVAMISSNLDRVGRKPRVFVERDSVRGNKSGLLADSVIMTDNLATIRYSKIAKVIGELPDMTEVERALKHSLGL